MSVDRLVLPGTGLSVSRLCLGGNRLGGELDCDRSFALIDAFVEAGGNFVDTAHVYADWMPGVERSCSEKTIGRWLVSRGAEGTLVVATKIGHPRLGGSSATRLDRASLRGDVAEALANLGLDMLDLVYLHRDDPATPAETILAAMEEMRREGLIRHYAASNWSAQRLEEACTVASARGWEGFVANQAEWSLAARNPGSAAADLFAMNGGTIDWHRRTGTAAVPYSSQARGYFDKLAAGALDDPTARAFDSPENRARGEALAALAEKYGLTPTEAMLGVFRFAPFAVVPVVGCRDAAQIASSFHGMGACIDAQDALPVLAGLGIAPDDEEK